MASHHSPFTALKYRDFRLIWLGLLVSIIGSQMQLMAVNYHIYLITHSALSLGIIGLARLIPVLFIAPISGLLADLHDRGKVILYAQFIMIFSAGLLAYLTFTHQISPFWIYFLIALNAVGGTLDTPARQSLIPLLVPKHHLTNAFSLANLMWQSSIVIGPSLAGFVIAGFGVGMVYVINAISFLAIIFSLLLIKPLDQNKDTNNTFSLSSLKSGFHFVFKTPLIYSTMLLDFFASFFGTATVLMPIFALDLLKVGPEGLGFLYAAPSIGGVLAGLILSSFKHLKNQGKILIYSVLIYGLATVLFGISRVYILSLIFLAVSGAGDAISSIIRNMTRQMVTPDSLRGRMTSVNMLFYSGGPQLGEIEAGIAASILGAPISVVLGGLGTIISTIIVKIKTPSLIKYQGDEALA